VQSDLTSTFITENENLYLTSLQKFFDSIYIYYFIVEMEVSFTSMNIPKSRDGFNSWS
jgi:hypothetical protein